MRPTCFALLVKNFFIRVVGGSNKAGPADHSPVVVRDHDLHEVGSSVDDYRGASIAIIPMRFEIEPHSQTNPTARPNLEYPYRAAI